MKLHFLLPTINGIPVLMYHRIMPNEQDGLTISTKQLIEQWNYLKVNGYKTLSLEQFYDRATGMQTSNAKEVLLTFDDGYRNNFVHMKPLLEEFGFHATIFIIADAIANDEKPTYNDLMTVSEMKQFDNRYISFGLHGFHHENFKETSLEDLKNAISKSIVVFKEKNLPFYPALAYPYGARPEGKTFIELKKWMKEQGINMAFRIGNKPSKVPAQDLFEIKRIDIRGTDSLDDFAIKLKKGKLKPF
jgi:peptidoglycan/xylan/chitin deacetylase (PgdA/CDA1 family)